MAYSRVVLKGDGTTTQFAVNFAMDYLLEADVTCRVGTEVDGGGNPVYRGITFLSTNLIKVAGTPAGNGVDVVFTRTIDKETLRVNFSNGDQLDEDNLDTAQKQAMMAVHEVLDGRFAAFTQDFDAGGFGLTNIREPVADDDVATKAYVDAIGAADQVQQAQAAANASAASAATAGVNSADAFASANSAANQVTLATAQASAATTKATQAASSATNAATSASTALTHLNDFKGRWYGALAANPSVDPLGNALTAGDVYYNTASNEIRVYSGSAWAAITSGANVSSANNWNATQTFSNATYSALFSGGPVGINNATPTAPLHVGGVAVASSGSNIVSARASTGSTSVHGFAENSTINLSAAGQGMDSYDARMVVTGSQTYDHAVSYQSRIVYGSSGLVTNLYGFWDGLNINGPVTNAYGHYTALPVGSGTITNSYGFYCEALTKGGTLNYAFFSAGTTPSKFGGSVDVGGLSLAGVDQLGAWTAYTPTMSAGSGALGTGNSATGRYKRIGKTVFFSAQVNLGASGAGTAGTYLIVGLPVAAKQLTAPGICFSGIRSGLVGLAAIIDTTTTIDVVDAAAGANPIANSRAYYITGSYEAA